MDGEFELDGREFAESASTIQVGSKAFIVRDRTQSLFARRLISEANVTVRR